jgi:hypothetical protein
MLALGVRNQGPDHQQVEQLHAVVVGQMRAPSFTRTWSPDSSAEEADCSDLEHAKAVARRPICPQRRNNHEVGTIGVVPTSEQRRIWAHTGVTEAFASREAAGDLTTRSDVVMARRVGRSGADPNWRRGWSFGAISEPRCPVLPPRAGRSTPPRRRSRPCSAVWRRNRGRRRSRPRSPRRTDAPGGGARCAGASHFLGHRQVGLHVTVARFGVAVAAAGRGCWRSR